MAILDGLEIGEKTLGKVSGLAVVDQVDLLFIHELSHR